MFLVRPLGWILFVLGIVLLGYDLWPVVMHHGGFRPISFDGFIERSGVVMPAIGIVERLWELLVIWVLRPGFHLIGECWAFVVCVILGGVLLSLTGGLRRRGR